MTLFPKTRRFFRIWFSPTLLDELEILYAAQQRLAITTESLAITARQESAKQRRQLAYLQSCIRAERKRTVDNSTQSLGNLPSTLDNSPPSSNLRPVPYDGRLDRPLSGKK